MTDTVKVDIEHDYYCSFICDTIVVKALEDIQENEEVFNCYGIGFRGMNREQRQIALRSLYHFECKCEICSDQSKEVVSDYWRFKYIPYN